MFLHEAQQILVEQLRLSSFFCFLLPASCFLLPAPQLPGALKGGRLLRARRPIRPDHSWAAPLLDAAAVTQGFTVSAAAAVVAAAGRLEGSWAAMDARIPASCLPPIHGTVSSSAAGAPEANNDGAAA